MEPRLLQLLGPRGSRRRCATRPRVALRRLARLLRAHRRARRRHPRVRGPAVGRRRPARLHRPHPRVVARSADLPHRPRPTGAPRSAARLGRRSPQLHLARARAAAMPSEMRELLAGLVPGLPDAGRRAHPRARGGDPAVRGRDRPDAPGRGPAGARGRGLPADRRPRRAVGAGIAPRPDRLAPRRAGGRRIDRCSRRRRSSARPSASRPSRRSAASSPTRWRRTFAGSSGARC